MVIRRDAIVIPAEEGDDMAEIAIVGTLAAKPGRRDAVLAALLRHRERCVRTEPGLLSFDILVSREDEQSLLLYELYANQPAVSAHLAGPSLIELRAEIAADLAGLSGIQCLLATSRKEDDASSAVQG
jgi:quinol monooxygenase YgiN